MFKFFGSGVGYGIAIGVGAALLVPIASKVLGSVGKPLLKESIKGGLFIVEKGKVIFAETVESLEDLTAEARAELMEAQKAAGAGVKKPATAAAKK